MQEFDLDRYLARSKPVDLTGVAWDQVDRSPLSEADARCLAYMMDIESHTSGGCEIFRRARTQARDRADRIPVRAPGMWVAVPA